MDQIVAIEDIKARARRDFERGIYECHFPWNSAASATWLDEIARLRRLSQVAARIVEQVEA
jgi:hypothetical protein